MEKNVTDKKIDLLKSIEYSNDFNFLSEVFLKWKKQKSNETIDKLIAANLRMYFYTFNMEEEIRLLRKIVTEYRADKNRAIERARKSELKINELQDLLKKYIKL